MSVYKNLMYERDEHSLVEKYDGSGVQNLLKIDNPRKYSEQAHPYRQILF